MNALLVYWGPTINHECLEQEQEYKLWGQKKLFLFNGILNGITIFHLQHIHINIIMRLKTRMVMVPEQVLLKVVQHPFYYYYYLLVYSSCKSHSIFLSSGQIAFHLC